MAGMGDEDEFQDAEDGAGTAPPPSSSPASTTSKSKPAAAAGGFGSRLLASIRLPTSFSTAIGRYAAPSSPKPQAPQPPAGPNLGLGLLLLHQGPHPSADGSLSSDTSVRNLNPPTTPDSQKQTEEVLGGQCAAEEEEDQVIRRGVSVGGEQSVLAPTGEEGREKEDVAGECFGIRNGDLIKEEEQQRSDELGADMGDQEVMDQEGATIYYTAVEYQSSNNTEQWAGDASAAIKDDSAVEEKETVEKGCAVGILGESEDGFAGGLQEGDDGNVVEDKEKAVDQEAAIDILGAVKGCVDVVLREEDRVVEAQGEHDISGKDQYNVVKQCTSDEMDVSLGDSTVQDQEVVVEQAEYVSPEEHNNNTSMMQCTSDELSEVKDSNIAKMKEKALEQEGKFGILGAAENCVSVGLLGEDNLVVEGQGADGISVQDLHKLVEQCITDDLGFAMGDSMVQDQAVAVLDLEGVTRCFDAAVEGQLNNCAELCTSDELEATKDDSFVEEKKKAVVEGAIDILGSAKDDIKVRSQEEGDAAVFSEGDGDVISLQDHYKGVKQCSSDEVRTTGHVNAAHEQEVMEQEGIKFVRAAAVGDIAIDAHEKAVEQFAGNESRAIQDTDKVVDKNGLIEQDVIKGGSAVESQEDESMAVKEQSEDGVSVQGQGKVVEQCSSDQWGRTVDDSAAKDQEVRKEKIRICVGYPQRPGKPNCGVYMSTGSCAYGLSCYYNHPQVSSLQLKAKPELPSFPAEQGNCEAVQILELNRVGLPIRENARNCTYYMRKRTCGYGKRCCFNHPEHVLDVQLYKPTGWDDTNLPSSPHAEKSSSPHLPSSPHPEKSSPHSKNSYEHATLDDISSASEILPPNILHMLFPPQTVPPDAVAKETMAKKDPDWSLASDDSDGCCSADSSGGPLCKQEHHVDYPDRPGSQECSFLLKYGPSCQYYHPNDKFERRFHLKVPSLSGELTVYPDRPGVPECPFYMKTGTCKFGTECKFHHPKDFPPRMHGSAIPKPHTDAKELHPETKAAQDQMDQQENYPERPGQPECRYYMQFGRCRYLSACKFHHPKDRVVSMPECPFYKTGTCQFGSACEFYHPEHRFSSKGGENDDGIEHGRCYPERPGVNECSHYMKHGYCKFQMNCKYHHPVDRISRK